jgi:diacylglycerol kinase family enzyme
MAGVGIDAAIMQETNVDLKKAVGSAAYFVAAARNANHPPVHVTISVDDGPPIRRRTHLVVLGNVGYLQGGIPLIPDAKPDDGKLDVLIASPRRPADWAKLVAHVVARRRGDLEEIERATCTKIKVEVAEGDHYELDGDPAGHCYTMAAEILPHALNIRVPR